MYFILFFLFSDFETAEVRSCALQYFFLSTKSAVGFWSHYVLEMVDSLSVLKIDMTDHLSGKGHANSIKTGKKAISIDRLPKHADENKKKYESFLKLPKYVSFLRSGPRGAFAGQLGTDRCSNKEL